MVSGCEIPAEWPSGAVRCSQYNVSKANLMSKTQPTPQLAPTPDEIPSGHRLLAWDGIGLFVPKEWSIGRHDGDSLFGSIRVDTAEKVVARVRWWRWPIRFW